MLMVIGTDFIGSRKSNYTITTITAPDNNLNNQGLEEEKYKE
jgi:hypothetical protein